MEYNESNHDEKMEDKNKDNNKTNRIRSQMNINDLSNPIEEDRSISTTNSTSVSPTTKRLRNANIHEKSTSPHLVPISHLPSTQSQSLQPLKLSTDNTTINNNSNLLGSQSNDRTWSLPNNYQTETTTTTTTNIYSPSKSTSHNSPKHDDDDNVVTSFNRIIPHIVSPQSQIAITLNPDPNNNNSSSGAVPIQTPLSTIQRPQSVILSPPPPSTQYQTPLPIGQPMLRHQRQSISGIPLPIHQSSLSQQRPSLVATSWPPHNNINGVNNINNNTNMIKYNIPPNSLNNTINMEFGSPTPPTQRSETTTPILTDTTASHNIINNPNFISGTTTTTTTTTTSNTSNTMNHENHSDDSGLGRSNSNPHDDESETIYLSKKGTRRLRDSKRAVQNRNAQKAFRQRKEKYVRLLENKARKYDELMQENVMLRREIINLKNVIFQLDQRLQMFNDYYVNELQHQPPPPPPPLGPPQGLSTLPPQQQMAPQMQRPPPHQYPPPPPQSQAQVQLGPPPPPPPQQQQ